jgi:ABC-type nitrate/sulfonate/bicarbonate transport system substrate-binding protein
MTVKQRSFLDNDSAAPVRTSDVVAQIMHSRIKLTIVPLLAAIIGFSFVPAARSQDLPELLLGTQTNSISWFPLYVAMKKGLFREYGFTIKPVILSNQAAVPALVQKEIPYITNLGRVMSGAGRGLPVKQIMILAAKTHHLLLVSPEIASVRDLRGRVVAVSQPGATPHKELLAILKKFDVNPAQVGVIGLGSDYNRVMALRQKRVDAVMTAIPYDFLVEKEGYRRLVFVKDVIDLPLSGLAAHDDRIRERPAEVRNVIGGVLKGIAYTRTRRDEVLPLLQEFIKLESAEMTRRAYEAIKDVWPENGLSTDEGLKNVLLSEEIPIDTPLSKMTNWGPLNEAVAGAKRP